MGFFKQSTKYFYCAFCRSERSIKYQKHITMSEVMICFSASLTLMLIFWQNFDFKFFIFFAVFLGIMEFVIQIKGRLLLVCPHCGFDPVLYKKDSEKCALKVKEYLDNRKTNPVTLFYKQPVLNLPKIKKNETMSNQSKSALSIKKNSKNLDLRL